MEVVQHFQIVSLSLDCFLLVGVETRCNPPDLAQLLLPEQVNFLFPQLVVNKGVSIL